MATFLLIGNNKLVYTTIQASKMRYNQLYCHFIEVVRMKLVVDADFRGGPCDRTQEPLKKSVSTLAHHVTVK